MSLQQTTVHILGNIQQYLQVLNTAKYTQALDVFSNSTIGQHTRHTVEFFFCLLEQSQTGIIDYDKRQRNRLIETDQKYTIQVIDAIIERLAHYNLKQPLQLAVSYSTNNNTDCTYIDTTFERELVYNIEHAIHHMALIKIGLRVVAPQMQLPPDFGVAPSTIKYQQSVCAQ